MNWEHARTFLLSTHQLQRNKAPYAYDSQGCSPGSQRLFHSMPGHFPTRTSSSTTLLTVSLRLHLPAEKTRSPCKWSTFTTCYRALLPVATNFRDKLLQPLSNTPSVHTLCAIPTSKRQLPNPALASWEVLAFNYFSSYSGQLTYRQLIPISYMSFKCVFQTAWHSEKMTTM